ncbi:MAG: hypothetical protein ACYTEW_22570 [Planctomycetota bacterium]
MKILRFAVISFFIVLGLLVLVGSPSVQAANYLGEFCWQDEEGGILRLAITNMGDGHYIVNGRLTPTVGNVEAVHGNAEVVLGGTKVLIHLTTSGFDASDAWSYTGTAVLNLPGLDGFVDGVSTWYDKQGGQSGITWDGQEVLTRVACP